MIKRLQFLLTAILILAAAIIGYIIGMPAHSHKDESRQQAADNEIIWTCSMHPQIRLPRKGLCPICNMDLIPLKQDEYDNPDIPVSIFSKNAIALMDVEVMPVERRPVEVKINMLGKVDYDETRLSYITAWNAGRLDKLFVDYTGVSVGKGEPMVSIYSPELIIAQEEYLQVLSISKQQKTATTKSVIQAAKDKLNLLGLTESQIQELEDSGKPTDYTTIYAPSGGIVINKNATEGMYVQEGTKIYTLADISKVWILLDAYESDLQWLQIGQKAEFTTTAKSGFIFTGKVGFIDPFVNKKTRTVRVRLQADNSDGFLKPGMFVKAAVYSPAGGGNDIPLVIPASAPLIAGRRAVVYVRTDIDDSDKVKFEGREVVLGSRADDYYIVSSGLEEGELVAVRGGFKIDSSMQISAKPSMMSRSDSFNAIAPEVIISVEFKTQLSELYDAYFGMCSSLAADDFDSSKHNAAKITQTIDLFDTEPSYETVRDKWRYLAAIIKQAAGEAESADDISLLRESFQKLSQAFEQTAEYFGSAYDLQIYVVYCPMAFDNKGANWLTVNKEVLNPYFGEMMLKCGEITKEIAVKPIWEKRK